MADGQARLVVPPSIGMIILVHGSRNTILPAIVFRLNPEIKSKNDSFSVEIFGHLNNHARHTFRVDEYGTEEGQWSHTDKAV